MKECKECGGTGKVINDKYCKCVEGQLLKVRERAQANAAASKKQNEIGEKVEKLQQEEKRNKYRIPLLVGDWVEITGVVCVVKEINEHENCFLVESSPKSKPARQMWVTYRGQKPMPLERFDDPATLRQLVDMALMFKDENWFNELSGGEKNE